MSNSNKGMTAIALGGIIGTIGDIGLTTNQWLAALLVIAFGFGLIVNGFILLGTPE